MSLEFLPGIIGDAELSYADEKFFAYLKPLLDDKIAIRILNYWQEYDSGNTRRYRAEIQTLLDEKVALSKSILSEAVTLNTFHLLERTQNLLKLLNEITPATLKYYAGSLTELSDDLEWLLANRSYWQNMVEVRKVDDFKMFISYLEDLEIGISLQESLNKTFSTSGLVPYKNLVRRVQDNREAFYSSYEKRRSTHLYSVFSRASELHILSTGIKYCQYCQTKHISLYERRYF